MLKKVYMINLYHLKYFSDAVALGGITQAALKNRVGRSAISQGIKALELTLGASLLIHQKNAFVLTEEGRALQKYGEEVFSSVRNLQEKLKSTKKDLQGPLNIGVSHSIGLTLLPKILAQFSFQFPKVELNLFLGNATKTSELLRAHAIDVGIAMQDRNEPFQGFQMKPLKKGKFVLACNKKGRVQEKYLVGDKGEEVVAFKKVIKKSTPHYSSFISIQSWEMIAALIKEGMGFGLIPDFLLEKENTFKIVTPPEYSHSYEIRAIYRNELFLSKATQLFLASF